MGVEVIANDNGAVFVDNTSGMAFGPRVKVARMSRHSHRKVAERVLDNIVCDVRELWSRNPDAVRMHINDAKLDLFPAIYDEEDFENLSNKV